MESETHEMEMAAEPVTRPAGDPASAYAAALNSNIAGLIDDVKRQRAEIVRLNASVKGAKSNIDQRSFDELKSKQDLLMQIRLLRREKEDLAGEVKNLNEKLAMADKQMGEREKMIADLRNQNSDFLRQLQEKLTEVGDLKFAVSKLQMVADESAKSRTKTDGGSEALKAAEEKLANYMEKFRAENAKVTKLEKQVGELNAMKAALMSEKETLQRDKQRLESVSSATEKMKASRTTDSLKTDPRFQQELKRDLEILEHIKDGYEEYMASTENILDLIKNT